MGRPHVNHISSFVFIQIEPFAALFWALGNVLLHKNTGTGDPARRPGIPQLRYSTAVEVGFNLTDEASPPYLYHLDVLFIYGVDQTFVKYCKYRT